MKGRNVAKQNFSNPVFPGRTPFLKAIGKPCSGGQCLDLFLQGRQALNPHSAPFKLAFLEDHYGGDTLYL